MRLYDSRSLAPGPWTLATGHRPLTSFLISYFLFLISYFLFPLSLIFTQMTVMITPAIKAPSAARM